jgi:hypothetical protein
VVPLDEGNGGDEANEADHDDIAGFEHEGRSAGQRPASPSPLGEQSFEILARRYQEGLTIDAPQAPQAEPAQAMPLLGLGKQRLDPDLALAQRLLTGAVAW